MEISSVFQLPRWSSIRHPNFDSAIHVHDSLSLFDLVPTISTMIGVDGANWSMIETYDKTIIRGGRENDDPIIGRNSWDEYIRQGKWKYLLHPNSGGWSKGGDGKPSQLYDMEKDQKEQNNLVDEFPEKAKEMLALIEGAVAAGRTTPGPKLENDAEVVLWKKSSGKKKKGKKKKKK